MFCSRCGAIVRNGCTVCPECGNVVESPAAAAHTADVAAYAAMVRKLGLWFVLFAVFNAVLGVAGLINGLVVHRMPAGPFEPWPHPPLLAWTYNGIAAWLLLALRFVLAVTGGAALRIQAPWARRIATVAAAIAVTEFPIGLLFGAYALVRLMGRRNARLYAAITGGRQKPRRLQPR